MISSSADPNPDDPEPSVLLTLKDNEYTRSMWDYAFQATYEVTLRRDALRLELAVRNPEQDKKGRGNDDAFDFTAALHTYVEVTDAGDASNVFVKGLEGKTYIDKALDIAEPQREKAGETLTFGDGVGLFDRVFLATEPETLLHVGTGAAVAVENTAGWTDTVVWNPHETLPGDAWKRFRLRGERGGLDARHPGTDQGVASGDQPVRRQPVRRRRISRRIPVFDERRDSRRASAYLAATELVRDSDR